jgi:hypothetical protein
VTAPGDFRRCPAMGPGQARILGVDPLPLSHRLALEEKRGRELDATLAMLKETLAIIELGLQVDALLAHAHDRGARNAALDRTLAALRAQVAHIQRAVRS